MISSIKNGSDGCGSGNCGYAELHSSSLSIAVSSMSILGTLLVVLWVVTSSETSHEVRMEESINVSVDFVNLKSIAYVHLAARVGHTSKVPPE